jgi:D-3-phosphoglycerate dehydrogenase
MNIAILDDYQDAVRKLDCASKLSGHTLKVHTNTVKGFGQLSMRLKDAQALILIRERTHITKQLIERLPHLKLISQTGKVSGHIDIEACTQRGIVICEGVGSPVAPAELTWALIMATARRIPQYTSNLKYGIWQQSGLKSSALPSNFGLGTVLRGKTIGIWGFGKIGQMVAGYAKAFGMKVQVWGREPSLQLAREMGYTPASSKQAFFESSDIVTLHLRLNPATQGIVLGSDLALMKPTAMIVNTSRAELIQTDALANALSLGRPGLGAVDVFESEPILQGHPLLRMENCVCTPHLGYVERDSYELYFGAAIENILNFCKGEPTNVLNPDALKK